MAFGISQTCYSYQAKQSAVNVEIADHLVRLTHNQRNWGFGLCFLYLRNVKGYQWSHKRVYRIYRELELNLRIKPKKRIVREKPEPLAVPEAINQADTAINGTAPGHPSWRIAPRRQSRRELCNLRQEGIGVVLG